jgi:hypothetical protein
MKSFFISILLTGILASVCAAREDNGSHVGNSGGSVEYEFAYVARTLKNYVSPCSAGAACRLSPAQAQCVARIRAGAAQSLPEALRFDSATSQPGYPDALYTLRDPLVLINIDRLYHKDAAGNWASMPFAEVIGTVTEIASLRLGLALAEARDLGLQVAAVSGRSVSSITLTGGDARLMAVTGSLLLSDNRQVTDLTALVLRSLPCALAGEKATAIESLTNLYWDEIRKPATGTGVLANAIGTIAYACPSSRLEGRLRLSLPFEGLPHDELGLVESRVRAAADSLVVR